MNDLLQFPTYLLKDGSNAAAAAKQNVDYLVFNVNYCELIPLQN